MGIAVSFSAATAVGQLGLASGGPALGSVGPSGIVLAGAEALAPQLIPFAGVAAAIAGVPLWVPVVILGATLVVGGAIWYAESNERSDSEQQSAEPKEGSEGREGEGKRFSDKVKDQAREESGNTCVFCGTKTTEESGPSRSEIDHAIPKSRGGNNSPDNAQNTCRTCNRSKGAKTTGEFLGR